MWIKKVRRKNDEKESMEINMINKIKKAIQNIKNTKKFICPNCGATKFEHVVLSDAAKKGKYFKCVKCGDGDYETELKKVK